MTTNQDGVTVGDIFVCSWGYNQTNLDWLKVTRVTKASCEVVPVAAKTVRNDGFTTDQVPIPHVEKPDGLTAERWGGLKRTNDGTITMGRNYTAFPWDGKPKYATAPNAGH